jgi:hypothetical protein
MFKWVHNNYLTEGLWMFFKMTFMKNKVKCMAHSKHVIIIGYTIIRII